MPGARSARSLACKSRKHASKSPRSRRDTEASAFAQVLELFLEGFHGLPLVLLGHTHGRGVMGPL